MKHPVLNFLLTKSTVYPWCVPSRAPAAKSAPRRRRDRAYRPWKRSEEARLRRQVQAGLSIEEMALDHHRSMKAVEARLAKLDLRGVPKRASSNASATSPRASTPPEPVVGPRRYGRYAPIFVVVAAASAGVVARLLGLF